MKITLKTRVLLTLSAIGLLIFSMSINNKNDLPELVHNFYNTNADSLNQSVLLMQKHLKEGATQHQLQSDFESARKYYKIIEAFVEYHLPETAIKINGANLIEAEPSLPEQPITPTGFQVLEEVLFNEETFDKQTAKMEIDGLAFAVNRAVILGRNIEFDLSNIIDALKLNLYRIITKGISGFDAPVALNSLPEAIYSLKALQEISKHFPLNENIIKLNAATIAYLEQNKNDFNGFDRAHFIVNFINPLSVALYDYQIENKIPFTSSPKRAIAANVPHLFSPGAINPAFYAPAGSNINNENLIALGHILFDDKRLSLNNNRSCATCHIPSKAFTDGIATNESLIGNKKLMRNTPSLINAAYQPVQFWDSRITFLEDQAHEVISNPEEMGGKFEQIQTLLSKDNAFMQVYKKVFKNNKPTANTIQQALAAYIRSLDGMNSAFDLYMRGNTTAMNAQQINGFNLFMGKAKCGTCHFMPTFNGSAPPYYEKMESEVLGVPQSNDTINPIMDLDSGKYHLYGMPHHLYSFKTATVRNAAATAPYMHNGALKTLRELIDFYNRGGGQGLGFDIEHQTLPPDHLHLTEQEKNDIESFILALTDTLTYKRK